MRTALTFMVISSLTLSACSGWRDSRANPSNWFGSSRPAPVNTEATGPTNPLIPEQTSIIRRNKQEVYEGTLVQDITDLVIEPTSTGGILKVIGLTRMQGAYDARLIVDGPRDRDPEPVDGVLTFTLNAIQPEEEGMGTQNGRTVRVGRYLSKDLLARTREIRVVGANSARSTRR